WWRRFCILVADEGPISRRVCIDPTSIGKAKVVCR
ncbi:hypothetical protein Hypma_014608, partial [Hypsizygus marmoreus]